MPISVTVPRKKPHYVSCSRHPEGGTEDELVEKREIQDDPDFVRVLLGNTEESLAANRTYLVLEIMLAADRSSRNLCMVGESLIVT